MFSKYGDLFVQDYLFQQGMEGGAGEDVHLPVDRLLQLDLEAREVHIRLFRPANSTSMSKSLSSVISPRTIDPKKAALLTSLLLRTVMTFSRSSSI
jgi:hypothetical protein